MTTLALHATGIAPPAEVRERYAVPARWPGCSPHMTGVELPAGRLAPGVSGRVLGPLGLAVPFTAEEVDEAARRWSWRVAAGPLLVRLLHRVAEGPDGGTTTGLRLSGPAPLVRAHVPAARLALARLVRD